MTRPHTAAERCAECALNRSKKRRFNTAEEGEFLDFEVTEGHAAAGDDLVTCCTVALLPNPRACRQWFRRMRKERPWETRQ